MDKLNLEHDDRRTSATIYLDPTAPPIMDDARPRPHSDFVTHEPPPAYEEKSRNTIGGEYENHYQVPAPSPRHVNSMEMKSPLLDTPPEDEEAEEDAMNRIIKNSMKGFNSNKWMHVKLAETKGWCGFRRTKKYVIKGEDHQKLATVKTEPSSCDCCVHLLFCGCLKKPKKFIVRDDVGNEIFYFTKVINCCRIKPTMEITTGDGNPIGKIVKQFGIRPTLITYDYNGDERFTLRGPWSAAMFRCGQMKFYASSKTEDGDEVNIGSIKKLSSCASVRFQTQEKGDRVTKLLLLASTFMIDLLYYKQRKNDKDVPKN